MQRVGFGYDVHRLVAGRRLIIGGVEIEYELGLEGHSDADVLCHAVIDALLGAAGLEDIGRHFPDDDPQNEGISSLSMLKNTAQLLAEKGWRIANVDASVIAEAPKLAPHRDEMIRRMADVLGCDTEQISVKATTNEGLGSVGRKEAIACYAVALVSGEE